MRHGAEARLAHEFLGRVMAKRGLWGVGMFLAATVEARRSFESISTVWAFQL